MRIKLSGLAALIGVVAVSCATALRLPVDPETSLAELDKWYETELKRAWAKGKFSDDAALNKERIQRAKEAIKGLEPAKLDPAKSVALVRLYLTARMPKEAVEAAKRFIASNPGREKKFAAQELMLVGFSQLQDASGLRDLLMKIEPAAPYPALWVANSTAKTFAPMIAKKYGPDAGVAVIERTESLVPFDQMLKEEADKTHVVYIRPDEVRQYSILESIFLSIAKSKAAMMEEAGRKPDAVTVREQAVRRVGPGGIQVEAIFMNRIISTLPPGTTAPAIVFDRKCGEFTNLAACRGKVVILDFFAHWCGPCKRGNLAMNKMYADLHDKGLEIVGVTRYNGYFGNEDGLSPEAESARMAQYKNEAGIPWPIVFGNKESMAAYDACGIPTYVVIDRHGKVSFTKMGFSDESHAELRKKVEQLLKDTN